ncbi:MAG: AmmeMemoRadiSam system protein B [Candidatus Omnitrophota bacterium]
MIRKPVVAGQFYTASPSLLEKEVSGLAGQKKEKIDAIGVVSPHAGYVYSGGVAGEVLSSIKTKPVYIILGPNHTGYGKPFGLDSERAWKTPLGDVKIDDELAGAILKNSKYIKTDRLCHDHEHSVEVQLPFLQFLNKNFTFIPIVISSADAQTYKEIGCGLAKAIKDAKKDVTIIASSDMTHYEPHESAKKKDMLAIEKILSLDLDGFLDTIEKYDISMCGFAPTAIMIQASIELGAKKAKLIKYNTSGDTSGDYSQVVGYAGVVIY